MATYAYFALHKLRILPSQFLDLDPYERAFIIAAIEIRAKNEKEKADEIERKTKK